MKNLTLVSTGAISASLLLLDLSRGDYVWAVVDFACVVMSILAVV